MRIWHLYLRHFRVCAPFSRSVRDRGKSIGILILVALRRFFFDRALWKVTEMSQQSYQCGPLILLHVGYCGSSEAKFTFEKLEAVRSEDVFFSLMQYFFFYIVTVCTSFSCDEVEMTNLTDL